MFGKKYITSDSAAPLSKLDMFPDFNTKLTG